MIQSMQTMISSIWPQPTTHSILCAIASVISISTGIFILANNWRSSINRSFSLITFTGGLWLLTFSFCLASNSADKAYDWLVAAYSLAIPFISPSVYLFTLVWNEKKPNRIVLLGYGWGILLAVIATAYSREIWDVVSTHYGFWDRFKSSVWGWGYCAFLMTQFFGISFLAFLNLREGIKSSRGLSRLHKQYFLVAYLVGYTGSVDFLVSSGVNVYPFGYLSFLLFTSIIAYAIYKHQLLEIRIAVRRVTVLIGVYLVLLAISWVMGIYLLPAILKSHEPLKTIAATSVLFGVLFSLGPVIYAAIVRNNFWLHGNIAIGLTHELKSPLSTIQSAIDLIISSIDEGKLDSLTVSEYARMIRSNASRLEIFVQDLLQVAKISEGHCTINKSRFDLSQVIGEVIKQHADAIHLKGIQISAKLESSAIVNADISQIRQAISNLIANAIKFSDDGIIVIKSTITGREISVIIQDFGRGIETGKLRRVFDRFYQADPGSKGAGIGLTLARSWIEMNGGKLSLFSAGLNKGTTVTGTFPRAS